MPRLMANLPELGQTTVVRLDSIQTPAARMAYEEFYGKLKPSDIGPTSFQPASFALVNEALDHVNNVVQMIDDMDPYLAGMLKARPESYFLLPEVAQHFEKTDWGALATAEAMSALYDEIGWEGDVLTPDRLRGILDKTPVTAQFFQEYGDQMPAYARPVIAHLMATVPSDFRDRVAALSWEYMQANPDTFLSEALTNEYVYWLFAQANSTQNEQRMNETWYGSLGVAIDTPYRLASGAFSSLWATIADPDNYAVRRALTPGQNFAIAVGVDPSEDHYSTVSGAWDFFGTFYGDPINLAFGVGMGARVAGETPRLGQLANMGRYRSAFAVLVPRFGRNLVKESLPLGSRAPYMRLGYALFSKEVDKFVQTPKVDRLVTGIAEVVAAGRKAGLNQAQIEYELTRRYKNLEQLRKSGALKLITFEDPETVRVGLRAAFQPGGKGAADLRARLEDMVKQAADQLDEIEKAHVAAGTIGVQNLDLKGRQILELTADGSARIVSQEEAIDPDAWYLVGVNILDIDDTTKIVKQLRGLSEEPVEKASRLAQARARYHQRVLDDEGNVIGHIVGSPTLNKEGEATAGARFVVGRTFGQWNVTEIDPRMHTRAQVLDLATPPDPRQPQLPFPGGTSRKRVRRYRYDDRTGFADPIENTMEQAERALREQGLLDDLPTEPSRVLVPDTGGEFAGRGPADMAEQLSIANLPPIRRDPGEPEGILDVVWRYVTTQLVGQAESRENRLAYWRKILRSLGYEERLDTNAIDDLFFRYEELAKLERRAWQMEKRVAALEARKGTAKTRKAKGKIIDEIDELVKGPRVEGGKRQGGLNALKRQIGTQKGAIEKAFYASIGYPVFRGVAVPVNYDPGLDKFTEIRNLARALANSTGKDEQEIYQVLENIIEQGQAGIQDILTVQSRLGMPGEPVIYIGRGESYLGSGARRVSGDGTVTYWTDLDQPIFAGEVTVDAGKMGDDHGLLFGRGVIIGSSDPDVATRIDDVGRVEAENPLGVTRAVLPTDKKHKRVYLNRRSRGPAKKTGEVVEVTPIPASAAVHRDVWDTLGDDQLIEVYHATSPARAQEHVTSGMGGLRKRGEHATDLTAAEGIYVGSDPERLRWLFGREGDEPGQVVAITIRKGDLVQSPEGTKLGYTVRESLNESNIGALVQGKVPTSRIRIWTPEDAAPKMLVEAKTLPGEASSMQRAILGTVGRNVELGEQRSLATGKVTFEGGWVFDVTPGEDMVGGTLSRALAQLDEVQAAAVQGYLDNDLNTVEDLVRRVRAVLDNGDALTHRKADELVANFIRDIGNRADNVAAELMARGVDPDEADALASVLTLRVMDGMGEEIGTKTVLKKTGDLVEEAQYREILNESINKLLSALSYGQYEETGMIPGIIDLLNSPRVRQANAQRRMFAFLEDLYKNPTELTDQELLFQFRSLLSEYSVGFKGERRQKYIDNMMRRLLKQMNKEYDSPEVYALARRTPTATENVAKMNAEVAAARAAKEINENAKRAGAKSGKTRVVTGGTPPTGDHVYIGRRGKGESGYLGNPWNTDGTTAKNLTKQQRLWAEEVESRLPSRPVAFTFPVKKVWNEKASTGLINSSLSQLSETAKKNPESTFLMPMPGTGHGGLSTQEFMDKVYDGLRDLLQDNPNIRLVIPSDEVAARMPRGRLPLGEPGTATQVVAKLKEQGLGSQVVEGGDIFDGSGIPVITTNLGGVHGAGIAKAAEQRGLIKRGAGTAGLVTQSDASWEDKYRLYVQLRMDNDPDFKEAIKNLDGKTLWCPQRDKGPCHGSILMNSIPVNPRRLAEKSLDKGGAKIQSTIDEGLNEAFDYILPYRKKANYQVVPLTGSRYVEFAEPQNEAARSLLGKYGAVTALLIQDPAKRAALTEALGFDPLQAFGRGSIVPLPGSEDVVLEAGQTTARGAASSLAISGEGEVADAGRLFDETMEAPYSMSADLPSGEGTFEEITTAGAAMSAEDVSLQRIEGMDTGLSEVQATAIDEYARLFSEAGGNNAARQNLIKEMLADDRIPQWVKNRYYDEAAQRVRDRAAMLARKPQYAAEGKVTQRGRHIRPSPAHLRRSEVVPPPQDIGAASRRGRQLRLEGMSPREFPGRQMLPAVPDPGYTGSVLPGTVPSRELAIPFDPLGLASLMYGDEVVPDTVKRALSWAAGLVPDRREQRILEKLAKRNGVDGFQGVGGRVFLTEDAQRRALKVRGGEQSPPVDLVQARARAVQTQASLQAARAQQDRGIYLLRELPREAGFLRARKPSQARWALADWSASRYGNTPIRDRLRLGIRRAFGKEPPEYIRLSNGEDDLTTILRTMGLRDEQIAPIISEYLGKPSNERWDYLNDLFSGQIPDLIDDPVLRASMIEFNSTAGNTKFGFAVDGEPLGRTASRTKNNKTVLRPLGPSQMSDHYPAPPSEFYTMLRRYKTARAAGSNVYSQGIGDVRKAREAKMAQIKNILDEQGISLEPDELEAMAFALVEQGDIRAWRRGLDYVGDGMKQGFRFMHRAFTKMQLAARPFTWFSRVVVLDEMLRGAMADMPSLYRNPFKYVAATMASQQIAASSKNVQNLRRVVQQTLGPMLDTENIDDLLRVLDEVLPGQRARLLAEFSNIEKIEDIPVGAVRAWIKRNVDLNISSTQVLGTSTPRAVKRAVIRNNKVQDKLKKYLLPDGFTFEEIDEIMQASWAKTLSNEIAVSSDSMSWEPTMSKRQKNLFGQAWAHQVGQLHDDPYFREATMRYAELVAKEPVDPAAAHRIVTGNHWGRMRENIEAMARYAGVEWEDDFALADWYLNYLANNFVANLMQPMIIGQRPAEAANTIMRFVHEGRIETMFNGVPFTAEYNRARPQRWAEAFGELASGVTENSAVRMPSAVAAPFDMRYAMDGTHDNLLSATADFIIQYAGEKSTQIFNRRPAYIATFADEKARLLRVGMDEKAADTVARQLAAQRVNDVYFNMKDVPHIVAQMNKVFPFFSALYEVNRAWMYRMPKFLGGGNWFVGQYKLQSRSYRLLRALVSSGLIEVAEETEDTLGAEGRGMRLRISRHLLSNNQAAKWASGGMHWMITNPVVLSTLIFASDVFTEMSQEAVDQYKRDVLANPGKLEFGISVGWPVDPTSKGLGSALQLGVGLGPLPGAAAGQLMARINWAGSNEFVPVGPDTNLQTVADQHEISLQQLITQNRPALSIALGTEALNQMMAGELDPRDVTLPQLNLEIPKSNLYEEIIDDIFFPYGRPEGGVESLAFIGASFMPSWSRFLLRGIALSGVVGEDAPYEVTDTGDIVFDGDFATSLGNAFLPPEQRAQMAAEVLRAMQFMYARDARANPGTPSRFERVIEMSVKMDELELSLNKDGKDPSIDTDDPRSVEWQDLNSSIAEQNKILVNDAVNIAMTNSTMRGLLGLFGPANPSIMYTEQKQAGMYYATRDFVDHGAVKGLDVTNVDLSDVLSGDPERIEEELQTYYDLLVAWMEDPSGDEAKQALKTYLPELQYYLRGTTYWREGGVPPLVRAYEERIDLIRDGKIAPYEPEIQFILEMKANNVLSFETQLAETFGTTDPIEQARAILANQDQYRELLKMYDAADMATDVIDKQIGGDWAQFVNREDQYLPSAYRTMRDKQRDLLDAIDEIQELFDSPLAPDATPGEIREQRDALRRVEGFLRDYRALSEEDAQFIDSPRDYLLSQYYEEYAEPMFRQQGDLYDALANAHTAEEKDAIWAQIRDTENLFYNRQPVVFTADGQAVTMPSLITRSRSGKSTEDQARWDIKNLLKPTTWLSQAVTTQLAESHPDLAEMLPTTEQDFKLYEEWSQQISNLKASEERGEIDEWEYSDRKQEIDQAFKDYLVQEGRESELWWYEATPAMRMTVVGYTQSIPNFDQYVGQIMEIRRAADAAEVSRRGRAVDPYYEELYQDWKIRFDTDPAFQQGVLQLADMMDMTYDHRSFWRRVMLGIYE